MVILNLIIIGRDEVTSTTCLHNRKMTPIFSSRCIERRTREQWVDLLSKNTPGLRRAARRSFRRRTVGTPISRRSSGRGSCSSFFTWRLAKLFRNSRKLGAISPSERRLILGQPLRGMTRKKKRPWRRWTISELARPESSSPWTSEGLLYVRSVLYGWHTRLY